MCTASPPLSVPHAPHSYLLYTLLASLTPHPSPLTPSPHLTSTLKDTSEQRNQYYVVEVLLSPKLTQIRRCMTASLNVTFSDSGSGSSGDGGSGEVAANGGAGAGIGVGAGVAQPHRIAKLVSATMAQGNTSSAAQLQSQGVTIDGVLRALNDLVEKVKSGTTTPVAPKHPTPPATPPNIPDHPDRPTTPPIPPPAPPTPIAPIAPIVPIHQGGRPLASAKWIASYTTRTAAPPTRTPRLSGRRLKRKHEHWAVR